LRDLRRSVDGGIAGLVGSNGASAGSNGRDRVAADRANCGCRRGEDNRQAGTCGGRQRHVAAQGGASRSREANGLVFFGDPERLRDVGRGVEVSVAGLAGDDGACADTDRGDGAPGDGANGAGAGTVTDRQTGTGRGSQGDRGTVSNAGGRGKTDGLTAFADSEGTRNLRCSQEIDVAGLIGVDGAGA